MAGDGRPKPKLKPRWCKSSSFWNFWVLKHGCGERQSSSLKRTHRGREDDVVVGGQSGVGGGGDGGEDGGGSGLF